MNQIPEHQTSEPLPVVAYEAPEAGGVTLVYADWYHKYGNPMPEGAVPLTDHATATARIAALEAELAEARMDAERLDWYAENTFLVLRVSHPAVRWYYRRARDEGWKEAASLRAAIDAARAQEKKA